jgi:hypothetical protein
MSVKSISTQQAGQVCDATHYLSLGTGPVTIFDIEGEVPAASANYYVQLLSTNAPVNGVTVPLYSRLAILSGGSTGFSFVYRPIGLDTANMLFPEAATVSGSNTSSVYVAISSTDNVYTSVAVNLQVTVDLEDNNLEIPNQTITGDTTTARDNLTVYTDPNATKELVQFQVTNNLGAIAYLMLFAYSPANGDLPIQQWQVGIGSTITERFGGGWPIQQMTTAYVLKTGCYLVGSSTTQTLTKTTGTNWNMKAWNI